MSDPRRHRTPEQVESDRQFLLRRRQVGDTVEQAAELLNADKAETAYLQALEDGATEEEAGQAGDAVGRTAETYRQDLKVVDVRLQIATADFSSSIFEEFLADTMEDYRQSVTDEKAMREDLAVEGAPRLRELVRCRRERGEMRDAVLRLLAGRALVSKVSEMAELARTLIGASPDEAKEICQRLAQLEIAEAHAPASGSLIVPDARAAHRDHRDAAESRGRLRQGIIDQGKGGVTLTLEGYGDKE